ncbi:MAG TPA: protein kinase [Blastocatellia bacterium]|nr:protein kinase [Blastocatellia bacterium]
MTPERWQQIETLFHHACSLAPQEQRAFLDDACAGDVDLRHEVELLLASDEEAATLLGAPALEMVAPLLAQNDSHSRTGQTIGHYQILAPLGAGGMGEVFLAQDTNLKRQVALKLLPKQSTAVAERVQRFEREARAASALNHPNILTIHEIGRTEEAHFIVTEYVEGQTLRQQMKTAQMNLPDALDIAIQIANALAAAHQAGIIHRDIKPENVMLRADGIVKVLDFGLAKLLRDEGGGMRDESEKETLLHPSSLIPHPSTASGIVMGTPRYMSPEQARGQKVDARTDIFSFGVLLYEMLAGRAPFEGESVSDVIAAILKSEPPPLSAQGLHVPPELERIVSKTLRKERDERYQTVKDLLLDLKSVQQEISAPTIRTTVEQATKRQSAWLLPALISLVVLLVAAGAFWFVRRPAPPPAVGRPLPLTSFPGFEINPALSPDGKQVAFAWNGDKQDNFDIYLKQVGTNARAQLTKHPAEDFSPAWSPDGNTIAFLRRLDSKRNELLLISVLGGSERRLAEVIIPDRMASRLPALAWSPDGRWLAVADRAAGEETEGLFLVDAQTGEKRQLTRPLTNAHFDAAPSFSPDGRTLLFTRFSNVVTTAEMFLFSLSADFAPVGEARPLKTSERFVRSPVWTPDGHSILYLAAPNVGPREQTELRKIAASGAGASELVAVLEDTINEMSLGRHLVYTRSSDETDIWRAEIPPPGQPPSQPQRFISSTRIDNQPKYSPDGKKVAFGSTRSGAAEIWIADADGSNPVQLTSFGGPLIGTKEWSPDSQYLVFTARPEGQADNFTIPAAGGVPKRLTTDPSDDTAPSYSRDGRWIYFNSARSGQYEVWKMPAEGGDAVKLTSVASGMPFESFDGKTLYFQHLGPEGGIWKIPVEGGAAVQLTGPVNAYAYAVGKEGLFYSPAPDATQKGSLQFFSFATGKTRTVVVTDSPIGGMIGLSPDQRFLAFALRDQFNRDLMLIENFVVR